jgi:hypothetical protein
MIPRMAASRASCHACRGIVAGCAVALALTAGAPAAQAPSPTVVKDARDAGVGAPDLTRVQLGLTSDRRLRAALTLATGWVAKNLLAKEGPPGSLCLRLWTVTKPGAAPPDFLACVTARQDGETTRGTVFKTQPGQQLSRVAGAIVGRTSDRTVTLRFSQTAIGKPATLYVAAETTRPGCPRGSCIDLAPDAPKTLTLKLRSTTT